MPRLVAEEGDPAVAGGDQVRGRGERAAGVVGEHAVGVDEAGGRSTNTSATPASRSARRYEWSSPAGTTISPSTRRDEERLGQLALALGVLVGAADERQHAARAGHVLDAAQHGGVERVGDVVEDQADARRRAVGAAQVAWPSGRAGSRAARPPRGRARRGRARTLPSPLTTRETVARLTPASVGDLASSWGGGRPCWETFLQSRATRRGRVYCRSWRAHCTRSGEKT